MVPPPATPPPSDGNGNALVLLGVTWRDGSCLVRLRVPGGYSARGAPSELVPVIGMELNYRVADTPRRHCLGHSSPQRNNGQYVDCANRPQPKEKVCINCAVANAEFASNLHHAHTRERAMLDRAVVEHLEQTNVLYLAAFRDGSIKIGTSTERRKLTRWAEQGAWRTVEVATTKDGFVVRQLEDFVTEKLSLPQSVAIKRKLHGMANPLTEKALSERLEPLIGEVHRLIGEPAPNSEVLLSAKSWSFPSSDDELWGRLRLYPSRLDRGTHHLEVVDMCGRMVVVARPDGQDRFVADLGQLFGIELDLGQYQPDELAIQDSLF